MGDLEPVDPGHHHVEEHEVGTKLRGALERLLSVAGDRDVIARGAEIDLHETGDVGVVVNDQDRFGHLPSSLGESTERRGGGGGIRLMEDA